MKVVSLLAFSLLVSIHAHAKNVDTGSVCGVVDYIATESHADSEFVTVHILGEVKPKTIPPQMDPYVEIRRTSQLNMAIAAMNNSALEFCASFETTNEGPRGNHYVSKFSELKKK